MAFNPNNYKPTGPKYLPVVLLLDTSGSMSCDGKIESLNQAVKSMIDTFVDQRVRETMIKVAIITFGDNGVRLRVPYTDVDLLQQQGVDEFDADGGTPLGCALHMAKDMIEDKDTTPGKWYAPAAVLVSDGEPNDNWEGYMDAFINDGRSKRCQRLAVAIGSDADQAMLKRFTTRPEFMFYAQDSKQIADVFDKVTMSVSQRATSKNPDADIPRESVYKSNAPISSRVSRVVESSYEDDDDDEF